MDFLYFYSFEVYDIILKLKLIDFVHRMLGQKSRRGKEGQDLLDPLQVSLAIYFHIGQIVQNWKTDLMTCFCLLRLLVLVSELSKTETENRSDDMFSSSVAAA